MFIRSRTCTDHNLNQSLSLSSVTAQNALTRKIYCHLFHDLTQGNCLENFSCRKELLVQFLFFFFLKLLKSPGGNYFAAVKSYVIVTGHSGLM
jgi:hypothetical protein